MSLLDEVVTKLVMEGNLSAFYKPHKLSGNYRGYWECHIHMIGYSFGNRMISQSL